MVSFQEPISSAQRNHQEFLGKLEKKRRWGDRGEENYLGNKESKQSKVEKSTKSLLGIEFHLETPSSSSEDWKQCLDIQSGQVHFYNTRSHKTTFKDPRQSIDSTATTKVDNFPMSLELELNLPCESLRTHLDSNWSPSKQRTGDHGHYSSTVSPKDSTNISSKGFDSTKRCPSWMSFEADHQEMVAAACMRCHMLVMLCKSSPSCPNCKFMHPPDGQSLSNNMFKPKFNPLHCKE